jgi:hypothetical protein
MVVQSAVDTPSMMIRPIYSDLRVKTEKKRDLSGAIVDPA